jgi:signal transduction histidine kinase
MSTERRHRPASLNPVHQWRSSLRLRLTVGGTALAAATFALGGLLVLNLYHQNLVDTRTASLLAIARGIGFAIGRGPLPGQVPVPVTAGLPRVQVLNGQNRVVGGDRAAIKDPPMLTATPGRADRTVIVSHPSYLSARRAVVVAVRVNSPTGTMTVVAAGSLDAADDQAWQAADVMAGTFAGALIVVALVSWVTAGRALRRVERLRTQVSLITSNGDLGRRVGVAPGTDELARLGDTLNQMLTALERSDERQRRFVSDAAHELRTPLAGITATLEVARSHPETADQSLLIDGLLAAHRRLGRLVNDLLVLAGSDAHVPLRRTPIDLAGVVTDSTRRRIPEGLRVVLGPVDHATVLGDESQLGRVMTNLLDNALHHARTRVEVSLTAEPGRAVVVVADDGPGVPPPDRDRIWDRFVRLDNDRARPSGGAGLGLSLVRELIASHGGVAAVADRRSSPGAAFTIHLPLHQARARHTRR